MKKRLCVLVLDGLGFYQIDRKGLFSNLRSKIPLVSLLSYSAGIYPSIWTSTFLSVHGYWLQYALSTTSKKRETISIIKTLWAFESLMRVLLAKFCKPKKKPTIPMALTHYFENLEPDQTRAFHSERLTSLFDVFEIHGYTYRYLETNLTETLQSPQSEDVTILLVPTFDKLGHRYGPLSNKIFYRFHTLDYIVKKLMERFEEVIVFSDHGMQRVLEYIDVIDLLSNLSSKLGDDYLLFLDSTMVRFWFFSDAAKDEITNVLNECKMCHELSTEEKEQFGVNFSDNKFGDSIFLCNPGIEIFPNFYHPFYKNYIIGLHGYDPKFRTSLAFIAASFPLNSKRGTLLDISPTILDLLDIPSPSSFVGKSLLQ